MLGPFQHEDARALGGDQPVPVPVEGTAGARRIVQPPGERPIFAKPAITRGLIMASAPPATAMSQYPSANRSRATPSAEVPEAQAVPMVRQGPVAARSMASWPAAMFGRLSVSRRGETCSALRVCRIRLCSSIEAAPYPPTPRTTATRAPFQVRGSRPASATASRAATTANRAQGSSLRAVRPPSSTAASNPGTRQEIPTGTPARSGSRAAVGRPAHTRRQVGSTPIPAGVTRPRPVTSAVRRVRAALTGLRHPAGC
ncbi:MAG TPA: hypothetical protein VGM10_23500 [Actinocrinis sp.]